MDDQPIVTSKIHQGVNVTGLLKTEQGYSFIRDSSIMDKTPNFPYLQHVAQPTPLEEALRQPLFSRFTLVVRVSKLHQGGVSYDGLAYKTAEVIDNSVNQARQITVYGHLANTISSNSVYNLTYMTLSKYNGLRVFKSSERTAMTLSDSDIVVPMAVTETFTGTVHSIVMSTLQTFYKCPHCDETLDCDGSSAWCEKCDVGLSTNAILKIKELRFSVRNQANLIRNFKCSHRLLEEMIGQSVVNKKLFFQRFIDTKVKITFEQSGEVVSIEEITF